MLFLDLLMVLKVCSDGGFVYKHRLYQKASDY